MPGPYFLPGLGWVWTVECGSRGTGYEEWSVPLTVPGLSLGHLHLLSSDSAALKQMFIVAALISTL